MGKTHSLYRITAAAALTVMLAVALTGTAFADINDAVVINDTNLQNALLALPGADADDNDMLSEGEIGALTGTLMLEDLGISDITGLQFATGITGLDLSGNSIHDISALGSLALTSLDVSDNYLDLTAGSSDMAVIAALQGAGCTVTYEPQNLVAVSGVTLNHSTRLMCPGDTVTLTVTVAPADAANKTVEWASENIDIASVEDGVVTAVNMGTVDITVTTQDGAFEAVCTVTIQPDKIASSTYLIGGGLLKGVAKYTNYDTFKASLYNGSVIGIYKPDGTEVTSGNVATGMSAVLSVGGTERDRQTIIVNGDANGDGGITISDYTLARLDILGLKALEGNYRTAADLSGDGSITISDYTLMRLDILNLKPISGTMPDLPEVSDPRIRAFLDLALLQQGKPYIWGDEGVNGFDCSGFIYYCLNQTGYSVGRTTADTYSRRSSWQYVDRNELQPGDLMFYFSDTPTDGDHIGHIGIYLGNGYHIHASSDYGYIVICRVEGWYDRMLSHGRRVFY